MLNIDTFIQQFCLANIYFLIIDVNIHETGITKKKMKSRQLVAEGSSTLTTCGTKYLKYRTVGVRNDRLVGRGEYSK